MFAFCTLAALVVLRVSYVVIRRLRSPLATLPGPKISSITGLWLMFMEFSRRRRTYIHSLHLQYGPIVRVAPDEVSFATWDAAKEIYASGGSGYDKTSFYRLFDGFDTPCMFSILDKGQHAESKRRFADRYSKSFIMRPDIVQSIKERAEEFVARCTEGPAGRSVNVYTYLHCYALDSITHHLFHPFGVRSLTSPSDYAMMQELAYHDSLRSSYIQHHFPAVFRLAKRFLGGRRNGGTSLASSYVLNTVRRTDVAENTVLHKLQTHKDAPEELIIASECMDHTVAGIDTTGDALCFLLHHLSLPSSASIQEELRHELVTRAGDPLDDLLYLDAVVKEGLRCFTPIPMSLPRHAPQGGSVIGGVYVPEGTVVSCQAYTLHRLDTRVFPDPEVFAPARWLRPEGAMARNQLFFAFAAGGRGCIGKHIALLEMKLLLREVYSAYRTHVAPEMEASMALDDQIISSRPKDQTCLLTFERAALSTGNSDLTGGGVV